MSFSSTVFVFLFFPVTLAGYYLLQPKLRNLFLVAASLAFYAAGDMKMLWLLLAGMAINYALGRVMDRFEQGTWKRRAVMLLLLVWNFGALFYYKYFMFTLATMNTLFGRVFSVPSIALPLGISFYTFRTVSYVLDVYWGTTPAQKNAVDFALYVSFFPQVTMGPITKYNAFAPQLRERKFDPDVFSDGVKKIIVGLFKKLVFANSIGVSVDYIFSMEDGVRTALLAWFGILGYLLQLYYDFSGYSDIATGLGKLFGFETPKNFDHPYLSKSIVEYWTRWHITLGTWLKDYLYTPVFRSLMGKKRPTHRCDITALFAVWLFAGFWHGAAWHYVVYGLYYFVFIALERLADHRRKKRRKELGLKKQPETKLHAVWAHVYSLIVIIFGQLLFRIDSLAALGPYLGSMFSSPLTSPLTALILDDAKLLFPILVLFCFPVGEWLRRRMADSRLQKNAGVRCALETAAYGILFVIVTAYLVNGSYDPFLYNNF